MEHKSTQSERPEVGDNMEKCAKCEYYTETDARLEKGVCHRYPPLIMYTFNNSRSREKKITNINVCQDNVAFEKKQLVKKTHVNLMGTWNDQNTFEPFPIQVLPVPRDGGRYLLPLVSAGMLCNEWTAVIV